MFDTTGNGHAPIVGSIHTLPTFAVISDRGSSFLFFVIAKVNAHGKKFTQFGRMMNRSTGKKYFDTFISIRDGGGEGLLPPT